MIITTKISIGTLLGINLATTMNKALGSGMKTKAPTRTTTRITVKTKTTLQPITLLINSLRRLTILPSSLKKMSSTTPRL